MTRYARQHGQEIKNETNTYFNKISIQSWQIVQWFRMRPLYM